LPPWSGGGPAYIVVDDEPVAWGTFLRALAEAVGAPPPRELPAFMLRPASCAHAAFTTSMRVSGAKAGRELGWAPSVPSWRQGIPPLGAAASWTPPEAGHSRYSRVALVARIRRAAARAAGSSSPPPSISARSTLASARRHTVAPHQCISG
jgi:hypothetical protein